MSAGGVVTKTHKRAEQDVSKQRRGVCDLINTLESSPNKGDDWEGLLDILHRMVKEYPLVILSTRSIHSIMRGTYEHSPNKDHEFLLWIVGSLLRVTSISEVTSLQRKVTETLKEMFQLSKIRDHILFCYLLKELIKLLSDVSEICRMECTKELLADEERVHFPVVLSHFQYAWNQKQVSPSTDHVDNEDSQYDPWLVELHNHRQLNVLLSCALELALLFPRDISQFCKDEVEVLYHAMGNLLEFSGLDIKQRTLNLLAECLPHMIVEISRLEVDHLNWCTLSLMTTPFALEDNEDYRSFVLSLVAALEAFFSPEEGQPVAVERFWGPLFTNLNSNLDCKVYPNISAEFQKCMGKLLLLCYQLGIGDGSIQEVLALIGIAANIQPLVLSLVWVIKESFSQLQDEARVTSLPDNLVRLRDRVTLCCSKLMDVCYTPERHEKSKMEIDKMLCYTEGMRVGLEVYARVLVDACEIPQLWWSPEQLRQFCGSWEKCLYDVTATNFGTVESQKDRYFNMLFQKVMDAVGTLGTCMSCGVHMNTALIDRCLWMVMLPWQQNYSSFDTLGAGSSLSQLEKKYLLETSLELIDKRSKNSSLHALSSLPAHTASVPKVVAFSAALKSKVPDLVTCSLRCLPQVMATLQDDSLKPLLKSYSVILTDDDKIWETLIEQLEPLVLAFCSGSDTKRVYFGDDFSNAIHKCCTVEPNAKISVRGEPEIVTLTMKLLSKVTDPQLLIAMVLTLSKVAFYLESPGVVTSRCLGLFSHTNPQLLLVVSHNVRMFFPDVDPSLDLSQLESHPVLSKLKAIEKENGVQMFTVTTYGNIAKFAKGNLFIACLYRLLNSLICSSSSLKSAAYAQLRIAAKAKHLTLLKMLSQHKMAICEFMVGVVCNQTAIALSSDKKKNMFHQISQGFGIHEIGEFFKVVHDSLVPLLVCRATPEASKALEYIAAAMKMISRSLLVDSIKYIFLYIVKHGQQQDLNTVSKFFKSEADFEMIKLLQADSKSILNLLLLNLSSHKLRVLAAIKLLAQMNQSSQLSESDDRIVIPEYLHPHLHGIVAYFNIILVRRDYFENKEKGKQAISSLTELISLMGPKYITDVKLKIMAMLRQYLTLNDPEITNLTLSAWKCFINSLDVVSLGPLLSQIVVALSPLISLPNNTSSMDNNPLADQTDQTVTEIFEFLIIENNSVLRQYFNEIYHIPDTPSLERVNRALKEHSSATKSVREELHYVLKGLCHERLDVREQALKALCKLLKTHRAKLEKYIAGSDTVDPLITEIITTLLQSLRGASPDMREDYAICFGELGAIDPGKLEIPMSSPTYNVPFYEVDADFAVDLLGELVRAYMAATSISYQDCCAYAMQETLSLWKCRNDDPESDGYKIWTSLSTESQEVLRPHLISSYSAVVPKGVYPKKPFFQSSKNVTFHYWIQHWCSFLIHRLPDGLTKTMFLPCSLVLQHDKSLAVYLLRYLLITILKLGVSELDQAIHKEIMAVLNHCAQERDVWHETTDSSVMCAQTIFTVLDYLNAWVVGKNKAAAIRRMKNQPQKGNSQEVVNVVKYLQSIPKEVMAHAAFRCQAYTRALMYLESYLSSNTSAVQSNLQFLQRIYVALDDYDSMAGVMAVRTSSSTFPEQILEYKSVGNYRSAAACYEKIIKDGPDDIMHHMGMLDCMMRQGEFTSACMHVDGLHTKRPDWSQRLNYFRVEASWKLGKWDDLENYLKEEPYESKNWDINLGRLLLAAKQKDFKIFGEQLSKVRSEQMTPLCTASGELGSYQRGYDYIVRLHMLHELEEGVGWISELETSHSQTSILHNWETRSNLIQESFRTKEPILSLRRVILGLTLRHEKEIVQYWLKSAKIARRAGHLQTAHSFLLNTKTEDYSLLEVEIELAEHKKTQSSSYEALVGLQKAIDDLWPDQEVASDVATRGAAHADALLLIGRWMEDTAHFDTQTVLKQYKKVISVYPQSEDGHFYLGKYYDRLMGVLAQDKLAKSAEFLLFIIKHYGKSLEYGNKYIYECMPRMLTLWLDFGSKLPDSAFAASSKRSQERERNFLKYAQSLSQMNELMKGIMDRLPPYQFLIAFSQLISRICHPNSQVFNILEEIILKLLDNYAQQSLWMMIAVSKSTHSDRESKCRRILEKAKARLPHCVQLIDDMEKLCDRLLEVCNKTAEPSKNHSMDSICRGLVRLTSSSNFSSIMVPLQSSMNVTLPGAGTTGVHNPFPGPQPTIERFDDKVEVLPSLQRPKKITVLASDGCSYVLLCKPKDDLRKDARLMEFNSLVNKCLRKDHESRLRRLHIRTYAVIPLNEECGLLEWVPNTQGFRNILLKLYQEKGVLMTSREMKDIVKSAGNDLNSKKEAFLKKFLPKHPPVFGEWFMRSFADPTSWYSSRLAYAHTSAVISMVGYVLGLGDRHGENILFDSTTGDCIHVDFNCLFNRGETFDVPEVVPFRLTHNMVHGLGATGYEGPFRKSCEAAMSVLRQQSHALICVLKTFIHDPLVEWEKVKGRATSAESTNEKAVKIVQDIEDRLQGKLSNKRGLLLSVEGQVSTLIKEATDVNNLCRMYIGWAPFM